MSGRLNAAAGRAIAKTRAAEREKEARMPCDGIGNHIFKRDSFLGFPIGAPYCMFCGKRAS